MDNGKTNRNSATKEFGVGRGVYGCNWVRMGLDVCDGVTGYGRTQKQGKQRHKSMRRTWFCPFMAGEISPDIMFCKKTKKNMHGEHRTGENGLAWVRADTCTGGESKNKNKKIR